MRVARRVRQSSSQRALKEGAKRLWSEGHCKPFGGGLAVCERDFETGVALLADFGSDGPKIVLGVVEIDEKRPGYVRVWVSRKLGEEGLMLSGEVAHYFFERAAVVALTSLERRQLRRLARVAKQVVREVGANE